MLDYSFNHVTVYVVVVVVAVVEVLLKAAGDAPIMVKKKWVVDGSKQVAYIIEFIRKYIKCEPQDSLVSIAQFALQHSKITATSWMVL